MVINTWKDRDKVIRGLGWRSYRDYLDSELWKEIKSRVMQRDCGRCRLCLWFASECVHHIEYLPEVLLGENIDEIICLCNHCHYTCEFKNGKKRSLYSARSSTRSRLEKIY